MMLLSPGEFGDHPSIRLKRDPKRKMKLNYMKVVQNFRETSHFICKQLYSNVLSEGKAFIFRKALCPQNLSSDPIQCSFFLGMLREESTGI